MPLISTKHALISIIMAIILYCATNAYSYTNDQLADAIFRAENSKSHPYGILAHYKHTTPRQACLNTIVHAYRDWNGKGDFIEFLGSRYCPVGCDNDNGTNQYWVRNVKLFLKEVCDARLSK
jgi:hypothetical protein